MEGVNNNLRPPLGRGQKIAAAALAVFAILAIGMWMVQFKKSIQSPLAKKSGNNAGQQTTATEEDSEEALKKKDTDGDGLSDWDELNIYKTSPYIEDSDSDGFSDKQEIDNDKDPNCPSGRDCYKVGVVEGDKEVVSGGAANTDNSSLNNLLNQMGQTAPAAGGSEAGSAGTSDLPGILSGQVDVAALRQALLDAGMDKKILDKISDADLMKSYAETLGGGQ